jgi:Mn2+/Fe2+ NRAMP family transporter
VENVDLVRLINPGDLGLVVAAAVVIQKTKGWILRKWVRRLYAILFCGVAAAAVVLLKGWPGGVIFFSLWTAEAIKIYGGTLLLYNVAKVTREVTPL